MTASTPTRTGGVLAVHAHPDDETLTSGALLATWAAAGLPALVVTCTRGERGEVIGAALAHLEGDGPALAAHREHEVAAACAALGAEQVFLDRLPAPAPPAPALDLPAPAPAPPALPADPAERTADAASGRPETTSAVLSTPGDMRYEDSGMAWVGTGQAGSAGEVPAHALVAVDLDEAAGRLALLLRTRRPDVVATYEPGGGYGHPDHVRAYAITMRAVALAADPAWPGDGGGPAAANPVTPAVLWAVTGPDALRAGYRALAADPAVRDLLTARSADRRATREGPLVLPDADGPLPSVADATLAAGPGLRVPVLPVLDRVLGALRAHATQVQVVTPTDPASGVVAALALSNLVLAPVLAHETYAWAPGIARTAGADAVWPAGVRAS